MKIDNNKRDTLLGIGAGASTYICTKTYGSRPFIKYSGNHLNNFSEEEKKIITNSISEAFEKSGLENKGVERVDLTGKVKDYALDKYSEAFKRLTKSITEKFGVEYLYETASKTINEEIKVNQKVKRLLETALEGENAFFSPITKQIFANEEKMGSAIFHEMGHAINMSSGTAIKSLAIVRYITPSFIPIMIATGLLKNKKAEGEQPIGFIDKTTTFIKNNCGKLAFIALIPTIAEEGLATLQGHKIAKQVLKPELAKKVLKSNMFGTSTYIASAIFLGIGTRLGIIVRDKIVQPKA